MIPRMRLAAFAVAMAIGFVQSAVAQEGDAADGKKNPGKGGAYTVLSWLTGLDETEDKPPSQRRIATERPDFSYATTTVGRGRIVLETGYEYTSDTNLGDRSRSHEFPQALLRMGLFSEWFELQIGQNWQDARTRMSDGSIDRASGFQDLFLGAKFGLTSQDKLLPESSIIVGVNVPTGSRELTNQRTVPSVYFAYAWDLDNDGIFTFCATTGAGQLLELENHCYTQFLQTAEIIASLRPNLNGYFEYAVLAPYNAIETKPEHIINSGLLYFVTDNLQLDIYGGIGLSRAAPDYFIGAGLSIRH